MTLSQDLQRIFADAVAHHQSGRLAEAETLYRQVLASDGGHADSLHLLGVVALQQGRNDDAVLLYERMLALHPRHADACNNLGVALQNLGRLDESVVQYRRAHEFDPANSNTGNNLASALQSLGDLADAIAVAERTLNLHDNAKSRRILVDCLRRIASSAIDADSRKLMGRALAEVWARPAELAPAVVAAIKQTPAIAASAGQKPPVADLAGIADDPLVLRLLRSAPVCDPELERLFAACRGDLLNEVSRNPAARFTAPVLELACALAEQCFVNEYVFAFSADEARRVEELEARVLTRLRQGSPVPAPWLAMLAAYKPLVRLEGIERLAEHPEPVASLIKLQVNEPLQERGYQAGIESLTPIRDDVSALVRAQYEENPFPRWLKLPMIAPVRSIEEAFVASFPKASFRPLGLRRPDILIAGCGTGQHSISTARLYPDAHVLAVDLSRASLAYALRKSHELGVRNIEHAQADILELRGLGRQFDLIESSGVLHHLGDPLAGLEVLASLLRPNGLMKLALYSEIARRPVVEIRRLIAAQGYAANAEGIRRCRQDILELAGEDPRRKVLTFNDFYSMSECRDLLFHAQEHRLSLPVIAGWLERLGLSFVTFDVPFEIERSFGWRFPDPAARTDLGSWHLYERDNPNTFVGMYQFWVQKSAGAD